MASSCLAIWRTENFFSAARIVPAIRNTASNDQHKFPLEEYSFIVSPTDIFLQYFFPQRSGPAGIIMAPQLSTPGAPEIKPRSNQF